jgi:hypothetical protein
VAKTKGELNVTRWRGVAEVKVRVDETNDVGRIGAAVVVGEGGLVRWWATWRRAWKFYNHDAQQLLNSIRLQKLNYTSFGDPSGMLKDQIEGKIDSWAVRWQASLFLQRKLTLYPKRSLVQNIGFDNSGTHSNFTSRFKVKLFQNKIHVKKIPIIENLQAKESFEEYYGKSMFLINVKDKFYLMVHKLGKTLIND